MGRAEGCYSSNATTSQLEYVRSTRGKTLNEQQILEAPVSVSFKLKLSKYRVEVILDAEMMEFGASTTNRFYNKLRGTNFFRRAQLRGYTERMCLLIKFDYMSKEAYGPLKAAEKGFQVNWAGYLYEKLMVDIELKDKRKSVNRKSVIRCSNSFHFGFKAHG